MQTWLALALFVLCGGLWLPLTEGRARLRAAIVFLAFWLVFANIPEQFGNGALRGCAISFLELAALQTAAALIFDLAVERARLPRFVVEMGVVAGYAAILFNLLFRLGVNVTGIFATSAVATAVIGLALQDMMSNIAGGIALELEGGILVGDYVKCAEAAGWVRHVRLRHTVIDTTDGDRVILPNSYLTRSSVTVLSKSRRSFVPFNMPYTQNPHDLLEIVAKALSASPLEGVAPEPAPKCVIQEMGPGHIRYAAVVWMLEPGHDTEAVSAVLTRIYFALQRAHIPVTGIAQAVEIRPAADGTNGDANPVDVLRNTPIFRLLHEPGLLELGARLHHLSFAPGELIIRQGDDGDSMYFITAGTVSISITAPDKIEHEVASVSAGDFFGETSLLTGARRNANVAAVTRVDCFKLDKAGLQGVLLKYQELAEDMSVVMAHREMELEAVRSDLDRDAMERREAEQQQQLLGRIRRFFGLNSISAKA